MTYPSGTTVQHTVVWHVLSHPDPAQPSHADYFEISAAGQFVVPQTWTVALPYDPDTICTVSANFPARAVCVIDIGTSPLAYRARPCNAAAGCGPWTYSTPPLLCCVNYSMCYAGLARPPVNCQ